MRKYFKIILPVFTIIITGVGAVFYFTADVVAVADQFFAAARANNIEKAYSYLSEEFKASTSKDSLEDFLAVFDAENVEWVSWDERSISRERAQPGGTLSTGSGEAIPLRMTLVKNDSGWKICSLEKQIAGLKDDTKSLQMPGETTQLELVSDAIHVFALAVNERSMKRFYDYVSGIMQRQYTVAKLDEAFKSFYVLGVDLTVLDGVRPILEGEAKKSENGVFTVRGYYPTKPSRVIFEQQFIEERHGWKLLGFDLKIKPVE